MLVESLFTKPWNSDVGWPVHFSSTLTFPMGRIAAAASAASCKQRAMTPAAAVASLGSAGGSNADAAQAAGLSYSVNDLVNFQPLQPIEAAANYQVPVGL